MKITDQNLEAKVNIDHQIKVPAQADDPLWTVEEVANYLRLKPETVRAMARRGDLRAVKIGRVWRFRRSNLEQLLQEQVNSL